MTEEGLTGLPGAAFDEMLEADGSVRPHWAPFLEALKGLGRTGLEEGREELRRLLRENGMTYSARGDLGEPLRPWNLDPIPLIVAEEEWRSIEAGLDQRARLLERVLVDLYGPRELIGAGLIPAELVFSTESFLLPCCGMPLPSPRPLPLYAADLARGPDGRMWVLSDRTQVPFGAGYALENRTVMRRVLAGLFPQEVNVRRLSYFFMELRAGLVAAAPQLRDDSRIVVLTPGPDDDTYFEHAYLATYLGYPLVQGADLTVRDGCVWLKSIDGLRRVDVIWRRVDDSACDSLELDGSSTLGVPGLLEAVRQGNVCVINPLGSGVLENPGLMPFLPAICRRLLGEELSLPTAATWWCGQASERAYVLEHIDEMILKNINPSSRQSSVLGARLTVAEKALWKERIEAHPHLYVGQEQVDFSTVPVLGPEGTESRHTILRCFMSARGKGYVALPGGLARSAMDRADFVISNQSGISKDTWVLSSTPEKPVSLWTPGTTANAAQELLLPSRVAENLFWVGRYAERAEAAARLLRRSLDHLSEREKTAGRADETRLRQFLRALTLLTDTRPGFVGRGNRQRLLHPKGELVAVALDEERPGSIAAVLKSLMNASYAIRDRWSSDTWRVLDDIDELWSQLRAMPNPSLYHIRGELDQLITDLMALVGLNMESFTHELGWLLLDSGRRVERGLMVISLIRATLAPRLEAVAENMVLESVLHILESSITYRRRYRSHLDLHTVLDLLLLDANNPRSLAYQLETLQRHIAALPRERLARRLGPTEQPVFRAVARLRLVDVETLIRPQEGKHRQLDHLLGDVRGLLTDASEELMRTYFTHSRQGRQLIEGGAGAGL